jgi:hypothetical protein
LATALERALGPRPSRRERNAITSARAGALSEALHAIGFDPLVVAVARRAPEQTAATELALSRLPDLDGLERRALRVPLAMFTALVVGQVGVCTVLFRFVVPVLKKVASDQGHVLNPVTQIVVDLLANLTLVGGWVLPLLFVLRWVSRSTVSRFLRRRIFWMLGAARVCAVASGLVRSGLRPEEVLPLLFDAEESGAKTREALEHGTLDGSGLAALGDALATRAEARAARLGEVLRSAVAAGGAFVSMVVLLAIYLAVIGLGTSLPGASL